MNTPLTTPNPLHLSLLAPHPDDTACASISAKQIIEGIHHAVTRTQRFQALQTAVRAFSHHNPNLHNYEMDLGAANALCLKLGYILQLERDREFYMQVEMTCASLKMVYGCSVERRVQSFRDVGYSELVPLLIQVWMSPEIQVESSHAILQALHVLRVYSKLEMAKPCLIHMPNLLSTLVQLIWSFESEDETRWIVLDKDAESVQMETMGIIKDLTFRTFDQDKLVVYNTKGLVPTLLFFGRQTNARRVREYVAAIWWNLAMSPNIASEMAASDEILSSLHDLMQPEESVKTRRNAISSIGNLATVPSNHEHLLSFKEGAIVSCLETAAKLEDDADSRRRAMRTLRCLCSGEAAHALRRRNHFCEFLASVAQNDVDRDTRVQALECMVHVAADVEAMNVVGDGIKAALVGIIETSNDPRLTMDACRPLSVCLSKDGSTTHLTFSSSFYAKLAMATNESTHATSHQTVASIVSRIVKTDNTQSIIAPSPQFLNLLTSLLSPVGPDFEESRNVAITTIHSLIDIEGNRRGLAEDEGLLTALVNYAMATSEADKKDQAKSLILKLVPEL